MKFACGSACVWVSGFLLAMTTVPVWSEANAAKEKATLVPPADSLTCTPESAIKLEAEKKYQDALTCWQSIAEKADAPKAKRIAEGHVQLLDYLTPKAVPMLSTPEAIEAITAVENYPAPDVRIAALWVAIQNALTANDALTAERHVGALRVVLKGHPVTGTRLTWIPRFLPQILKKVGGQLTDRGDLNPAHDVYTWFLEDYANAKDRMAIEARMKQLELTPSQMVDEIQRLRLEKKYTEASDKCLKLIEGFPWSQSVAWARKTLGLLYAAEGDYAKAVRALREVVELHAENPIAAEALLQIGVYYQGPLKDLEETVNTYEEVVRKFPAQEAGAAALYQMCLIYKKIGDVESAQNALQRLRNAFPSHPLVVKAKASLDGA